MQPATIQELDEWMTANCYNDNYAIGNRSIQEGCGLENLGKLFAWYYTERGNKEHLHYFSTEQEAVAFAFQQITADKFANAHLVGFIKERTELEILLAELAARKIDYWQDEIPYGGSSDPRTRVFVSGCDILNAKDLQEKFGAGR